MSIHLFPRSVTAGVRPVGQVAFLFICLPGVSLLVSALFRRQCSISIHLFPRSVTAVSALFRRPCISLPGLSLLGVRPFPLAMQHFYSCVFQVCHCWCPPFSAGHAAFYTGAAALFRWPCSLSIHLSPMRLLSFCLVPALLFSAA